MCNMGIETVNVKIRERRHVIMLMSIQNLKMVLQTHEPWMDTISNSQIVQIGLQTLTAKTCCRQVPKLSNNYKETLFVEEIIFCLKPNVQTDYLVANILQHKNMCISKKKTIDIYNIGYKLFNK
jgi:hypothetical protein